MEAFLAAIGWYNAAAGGFVLFTLLSPRLGQKVLGEWCQLIATPYTLGAHGRLFVWWAALTHLFFGVVNVLAVGALRSPRYGRGVWSCIPLFGGWSAWNLYARLG